MKSEIDSLNKQRHEIESDLDEKNKTEATKKEHDKIIKTPLNQDFFTQPCDTDEAKPITKKVDSREILIKKTVLKIYIRILFFINNRLEKLDSDAKTLEKLNGEEKDAITEYFKYVNSLMPLSGQHSYDLLTFRKISEQQEETQTGRQIIEENLKYLKRE